MKKYLPLILLFLSGCGHITNSGPDDKDSIRDKFYAEQERIFKAHKDALVKLGHATPDMAMAEYYMGTYDWHTGSHEYFGAYSFNQAAYDQAAKGWYGHFEVLEGSNELWPEDDWNTPEQRHYIKFDETVIGRTIPGLSMSWMDKAGKYQNARFTAKITGIKDDGHTLILDKRAPHHAEQWNTAILPDGYVDMCACTNNAPTEHEPKTLALSHSLNR